MELVNHTHPMRVVIKCKAKMQLQNDPDVNEICTLPDEELFKDIATTLFQSDRYQELRQSCRSKEEAAAIEDSIAIELAETYRQIKLQQQDSIVQRLNGLL